MLEKAFSEASMLPEIEQNVLARWVLDEIDSDKKTVCRIRRHIG
jgi:hypothetical protein